MNDTPNPLVNTKRKRAAKPVASFGAEIFQALVAGSKSKVVLRLPYDKAVYLRMRAHELRAAMLREKNEMFPVVNQCTIRIEIPEGVECTTTRNRLRFPTNKKTPVDLIFMPADSEFADALKAAGVEVKPIPDPLANLTTEAEPTGDDPLAAYTGHVK